MGNNPVMTQSSQYGGFVRNLKTGEYDLLFVTEFSALLTWGRTLEKAKEKNRFSGHEIYDVEDIQIRKRSCQTTTVLGEWEDVENTCKGNNLTDAMLNDNM